MRPTATRSTPAATPTTSRRRPSASAEQEAEIAAQVEQQRTALDAAVVAKRAAEEAAAEEDKRIAGLQRAAADRREGLARLTGQVNALTSRSEAADAEIQRLTDAREDAATRAERAQRDFTALETRVAGLDAGEEGLDSEHEEAVAALDEVEEQLAKARDDAQQADRERAGLVARRDALEIGLNRKDGAGALLAATDTVGGLLGSVAALLDVDHGYETAVAAALGSAADAVVVADSARRRRGDHPPQGRRPRPRRPAARRRPGRRPRLAARCRTARRTPSTWCPRPTTYAPRWRGCCTRSPSSTTCPPPAAWSPTCPTSSR